MLYLYCDGASRGNPGPCGLGAWAFRPEEPELPIFEISQNLGEETNNFAEWMSLLVGLEKILAQGEREVKVFMDSELVVRQVLGLYRVKHPKLQPLYQKFTELKKRFQIFEIQHIPRAQNRKADELANRGIDSSEEFNNKSL